MTKKSIEERISEIATPIIESKGFELVDVEYVKEGKNWYLRIYIDKPGGIEIDDCQLVSNELSETLDSIDPIEQNYFLEVSSPGLERVLKKDRDFIRHKGDLVEVKLYKALEGKKVFEGNLVGLEDNKIIIDLEDETRVSFERGEVTRTKKIFRF